MNFFQCHFQAFLEYSFYLSRTDSKHTCMQYWTGSHWVPILQSCTYSRKKWWGSCYNYLHFIDKGSWASETLVTAHRSHFWCVAKLKVLNPAQALSTKITGRHRMTASCYNNGATNTWQLQKQLMFVSCFEVIVKADVPGLSVFSTTWFQRPKLPSILWFVIPKNSFLGFPGSANG